MNLLLLRLKIKEYDTNIRIKYMMLLATILSPNLQVSPDGDVTVFPGG